MTKRTNRLDFYKSKSTEDPDSPKLTVKDIADFKKPRKVPQHILDAFPKMRGRPPKPLEERKVQITIRLHPLILDHFRSSGPGWQTRMEEVLLDHAIVESEPVVARKYSSGELRSRLAAKKRAAKKSA